MEIEPWWLLVLPLFFGLGWLASRIDTRHLIRQSSRLPDTYFKGLNFLVNEQPDRAIDAFVDVVRLDPETIELHFALGNLFRRRGETDRAIRVHQSLESRSDLSPAQRDHARFELGQDYMRAGLLDRAEDAFNRLEGSDYAGAALRHRLDLAQRVRDWPRVIVLAERLARDTGDDPRRLMVHAHCELAWQAYRSQQPDRLAQARRALTQARETDPTHPRPRLLEGEVAFEDDDFEAAIAAWTALAEIGPAHLPLVAERWLQAHERLGRLDEGLARLEAVDATHPSVDSLRALAQARARRDGGEAAVGWLREALARQPSLLGLQTLIDLRIQSGLADPATSDVALAGALIRKQSERLSRYVCGECGFQARRFYWQCPGCNQWDRTPPRRTEALESEGP